MKLDFVAGRRKPERAPVWPLFLLLIIGGVGLGIFFGGSPGAFLQEEVQLAPTMSKHLEDVFGIQVFSTY